MELKERRQDGQRRGRLSRSIAAAALGAGLLASSQAGNPWFTTRTVGEVSVPVGAWSAGDLVGRGGIGLHGDAAAAAGLIDLVICLEGVPAGDSNGHTQGTPGSQQDVYERIIQHFADAVYESTEGQHKLRKVRIYTAGKNADKADIVWAEKGHSFTACRGSVGEAGAHITMFNVFLNGQYLGMDTNGVAQYADYDYLADERGAGYVLGHEWGHYFYGLYDEFPLTSTDVPVEPSLMNSPWRAAAGDPRWLNFSIPNAGGGEYQDTGLTEQFRKLRSSGWATLVRNPADDVLGLGGRTCRLGVRSYYPELAAEAPVGGAGPRVDLPGTSRSDLDIIWMLDDIILEIVLDRSGSMGGQKLNNAKLAASMLVDQLSIGTTTAGVFQFDDSVSELVPLTAITSEGVKSQIKSTIASIIAGDTTRLYGAGEAAVRALNRHAVTNAAQVVFLLTDGLNNEDPATSANLIRMAQQSQVPLFTFGYGSDVDEPELRKIAAETGGAYYSSPTTLAAISQAFRDAYGTASSTLGIQAGSLLVGTNTHVIRFLVDADVQGLQVSFTHQGAQSAATVSLTDASGTAIAASSVYTSSGETIYSFQVPTPATGEWVLRAVAASNTLAASYQVQGIPIGLSYWASLSSDWGDIVVPPGPIELTARLQKDAPVAGARVTGVAIQPNGVSVPLTLVEEGSGIYTAAFPYTQPGVYEFVVNFDNAPGSAAFTYQGAHLTPRLGNEANPLGVPGALVGTDFQRSARCRVTVQALANQFVITPGPVQTNTVLVRQTGLFYQPVTVKNTGTAAINGFRLTLGSVPGDVVVYNAAGITNGTPYMDYDGVLASGQEMVFGVEYFVANRVSVPNPAFGGQVLALPAKPLATGAEIRILRAAVMTESPYNGAFVVEFDTTTGDRYHIQYSVDLQTWSTATPPIEGTGGRVVWMDTGPPKTERHPGAQTQRHYRIVAEAK